MGFPAQPTDASGVPISSSYIPNDQFYAIQASARKKTDASSNTYTTPVFEIRTQEDVRSGLVYAATTGKLATATNTNVVVGASLFNPLANTKTVLVLSARLVQNAAQADVQCRLTTTDPALGTAMTPTNLLPGGAVSSLSTVSSVANGITTSVTPAGTLIDGAMTGGFTVLEFVPAGLGLLLPAGVASGVALYQTIAAAGGFFSFSFKWVEY